MDPLASIRRALQDRNPAPAPRARTATATAIEVILAVALATAGVAALQSTAPPTGLGVLYLLSVLAVAIRRGERAALVAKRDATPGSRYKRD